MAERAIFLDRDNTIIENDGYLGDPSKVKLLQGAATAIAAMRRIGFRIIVVSNQSGVARGMFDEAAVEAVNQEMCKHLREQAGAHIDASYYCPYHPDAVIAEYKIDHDWRKPKPGMLKQAAEDFGLDLSQCWMIGDQPRDIAAGASAGCRTILLRDPDHPASDADPTGTEVSPNFIVKTLADAARILAREGRSLHRDPVPTPLTPLASMETTAPATAPTAENVLRSSEEINAMIATPIATDKLAERLEKIISTGFSRQENVKPIIEEILIHLRQQARVNAVPEFSLGKLLAMIAQFAALVCLLLGAYQGVSAYSIVDAPGGNASASRLIGLLSAGLWLLGATVLQGMVIALHSRKR